MSEATPMYGDRVALTADVTTLGTHHRTGAEGIVEGVHTAHLTVRMSDGRISFPAPMEVRVL